MVIKPGARPPKQRLDLEQTIALQLALGLFLHLRYDAHPRRIERIRKGLAQLLQLLPPADRLEVLQAEPVRVPLVQPELQRAEEKSEHVGTNLNMVGTFLKCWEPHENIENILNMLGAS